jgi:hypothetical protein
MLVRAAGSTRPGDFALMRTQLPFCQCRSALREPDHKLDPARGIGAQPLGDECRLGIRLGARIGMSALLAIDEVTVPSLSACPRMTARSPLGPSIVFS